MPSVLHAESMKYGPGGQTIRLVAEARRLNELPDWTCYVAGRAGGPLDGLADHETWYQPFEFRSFRLHPRSIAGATRMLRELRPDVVHTHSSEDAWIFGTAARLLGIPIVRGRHATHAVPARASRRFVYTHLADAFTVSGATIGELLVEAGVAKKQQVFNTGGGFDPAQFCAAERDPNYLKRELGLPSQTKVIGAACTVRPSKGVDVLVEAFAAIRKQSSRRSDNRHLVVVGEVADKDRRQLAAQAPGFIHFLGFRNDVAKAMGGMDVLVMPSRCADGIPQVIPQAMALRVPVVGTRAGGIPDAVIHAETGFLVDPEDPAGLARQIEVVLAAAPDTLEAMLLRAEKLAIERYTFDSVVQTYVRAYKSVLRDAGRTEVARAA